MNLPQEFAIVWGLFTEIICEPHHAPYSDQELADLLDTSPYKINLRRHELGIPDSRERKSPYWQYKRKMEGW